MRNLLIVLTLLIASSAIAETELLSFRVIPLIDHGRLEWSTGDEVSLDAFVVERSGDGSDFVPVVEVQATGSYSEYSFTDVSPLDVDMEREFYYRLKLVSNDGSYRYSEVREVSLIFTAVQQTWGSIKAMFR